MELNLPKAQPSEQPASIVTLLISLFLVLLTFFILLVSYSNIQIKKSREVMNNLQHVFTTGKTQQESFSSKESSKRDLKALKSEVHQVVASIMPLEKITVTGEGDELILRLPALALFDPKENELRKDRAVFYQRLSELLSRWQRDTQVEMRFIQSSQDSRNASLLNLRAGSFARAMENFGVPTRSFAVSIMEGERDQVAFQFVLRQFRPLPLEELPLEQPTLNKLSSERQP